MLQLFLAFGKECDNGRLAAFARDGHGSLERGFSVVDDLVRDALGGVLGQLGADVFDLVVRWVFLGEDEQIGMLARGLR